MPFLRRRVNSQFINCICFHSISPSSSGGCLWVCVLWWPPLRDLNTRRRWTDSGSDSWSLSRSKGSDKQPHTHRRAEEDYGMQWMSTITGDSGAMPASIRSDQQRRTRKQVNHQQCSHNSYKSPGNTSLSPAIHFLHPDTTGKRWELTEWDSNESTAVSFAVNLPTGHYQSLVGWQDEVPGTEQCETNPYPIRINPKWHYH